MEPELSGLFIIQKNIVNKKNKAKKINIYNSTTLFPANTAIELQISL